MPWAGDRKPYSPHLFLVSQNDFVASEHSVTDSRFATDDDAANGNDSEKGTHSANEDAFEPPTGCVTGEHFQAGWDRANGGRYVSGN